MLQDTGISTDFQIATEMILMDQEITIVDKLNQIQKCLQSTGKDPGEEAGCRMEQTQSAGPLIVGKTKELRNPNTKSLDSLI